MKRKIQTLKRKNKAAAISPWDPFFFFFSTLQAKPLQKQNMSSNHDRLCRDGIMGNLQIKSRKVLDKDANMDVEEAKIKGKAKVKQNLTVLGDVYVKGDIVQ